MFGFLIRDISNSGSNVPSNDLTRHYVVTLNVRKIGFSQVFVTSSPTINGGFQVGGQNFFLK